jgi:serine/threonine-protein kinase
MAGPLSDTMKLEATTSTPAGVPAVGTLVVEKYKVERVLGMGGMGVVLAVRHTELGEPYALKFLLPPAASDGEAVARFMREAKAAVRIKSEHVARVHDFGRTSDGAPYIVMEYLEGSDLSQATKQMGPLPVATAVDYLIQACAGLGEAHQLGIVHRDLKPSNLFLTRRSDGSELVKVLDFGISKAAADSSLPAITQTREVFGSPAYMAPEQIRSAKHVDARADIWSLGVILFELLTGALPFEGVTSAGLLAAISADAPFKLRALRPEASAQLELVIDRCLRKPPGERYASVGDLAVALAPFASSESQPLVQRMARVGSPSNVPPRMESKAPPNVSAPPEVLAMSATTEQPWSSRPKTQKTGSRLPVAVAAVVVLLLLGGGGAILYGRSLGPRPDASAHREADGPPFASTTLPSAASLPSVGSPSLPPTLPAPVGSSSEERGAGAGAVPSAKATSSPVAHGKAGTGSHPLAQPVAPPAQSSTPAASAVPAPARTVDPYESSH